MKVAHRHYRYRIPLIEVNVGALNARKNSRQHDVDETCTIRMKSTCERADGRRQSIGHSRRPLQPQVAAIEKLSP